MCIYPAKWDPVAAITFFETGCDISQNAKQLIIGRTVSAAGMCAYTCLFSCLVVLTLEVLYPNSRLHDTDHHPSYPSPGPPRTLLCIWRRLWALVHRSTHRPCKPPVILFLLPPLILDTNDRSLGCVNSCCEIFALGFSPPHQFSAGAFSLTSPSVAFPSPPLFSYLRHPRPSDPIPRSARGVTSCSRPRFGAIFVSVCVSLALQWGGNTKPWNDKAVIIASAASSMYTDMTILKSFM